MGVFKWQKYKLTESPICCCLERRKSDTLGKLLTLSYKRIEYALLLDLASLLLCPYRTAMGRWEENRHPQEHLLEQMFIVALFPIVKNLGTNQVSTQRRRSKQIVAT